jgi:thermitase
MADGPTGLPEDVDTDTNDWVLYFSNFHQAHQLPAPSDTNNPKQPKRGEGVVIGHPDTGYTEHPELTDGGRLITNPNVSGNFYDPRSSGESAKDPLLDVSWNKDYPSHGTSTASVMISGLGHPSLRGESDPNWSTEVDYVSGVAPEARLLPFRVTPSVLMTDSADAALARAIYVCISSNKNHPFVSEDIGVISVSLGREEHLSEKNIKTALQEARRNGIIVCAAAGQFSSWVPYGYDPTFPGLDENTICCGACNAQHNFYNSGFTGEEIDITAPGVDVWRAHSNRIYQVSQSSGTSYATAIVAGACALWQAHHGRANLIDRYGADRLFDVFKLLLNRSADDCDGTWDTDKHGAGVLDAKALLEAELPQIE